MSLSVCSVGSLKSALRFGLFPLFLCRTLIATPDSVEVFQRFSCYTGQQNTIDQTIIYYDVLQPWLAFETGGRLTESTWAINAGTFKAEIKGNLWGVFTASLRFSHTDFFPEQIGNTNLVGRVGIQLLPTQYFGFFGSFGWYERFSVLSGLSFLPNFSVNGIRNGDYVGEFGLQSRPTDELYASVKLSSIEEMEVFNINNPYLQVTAAYHPVDAPYQISAFVRYRILLGFGRLDELMGGLSFRAKLPWLMSVL